ncbi:MAG: C1 family peptidase [Bacteroidota bacterium]|nr:C1 family peptidase [Bacteroidota bacterium]
MKKISQLFVLVILSSFFIQGYAQNNGSISDKMLDEFRKTLEKENITALQNAISNNSINKLAKNQKNAGKVDHYFSHKVKTSGITNQKSSGRCWLFTGLNVFRPVVMNKYNLSKFEFSEAYSFFYDQLEKSNLFLEAIIATADKNLDDKKVEWLIKHPINDGGQWTTFSDNIAKYGLVPMSAMPETHSSENTRYMSKFISKKLKEDALKLREMHKNSKSAESIQTAKKEMLTEIYKLLAINLGEPPQEFTWRYKDKNGKLSIAKKYTPKEFYKEAVGVELSQYVMFMNDPTRKYHKLYNVELDRSIQEGTNWNYINLPTNEIKEFAKQSIINDNAMYFSCDVGKFLDRNAGTLDINNYDYNSLFGVNFGMNKKQRIQTFESGSSHGMALIGVDIDEKGNTSKWLLENSWGASAGHNGYLAMTDEWFDEYMFRVVIKKEFVSKKILKILEQKAIMLPPWDPMYNYDK